MSDWKKGDIIPFRIRVTQEKSENVTISAGNFEVFDHEDASVQGSTAYSIDDNGTAEVTVYGTVDTSQEAFIAGDSYRVKVGVVIGSYTFNHIFDIPRLEDIPQ